ncbi:metallophosphoesterase [Schaalia sp. Marseille-Q2122]|uniref:metallophosphoesterase n=1 Tax=Schaalia sp. Marseille-Q2122 TaxID=2736604 RepID=UPI001589781B|nr:metallophosphoesterase [Schaalia sp. Marseille-Q2122]
MPLSHTGTRRALGVAAGLGLLGASALAWGYVERRLPTLRRYDLFLPSGTDIDLRVLHIADLHMFAGQGFIRDFLAQIAEEEDIDFVVSTGDNMGGHDGLSLAIDAHAPFFDLPGAFVFGSNDYYSPERKTWTRYLRKDPRTARSRQRTVPDLPWEELRAAFTTAGWVDLSNESHALPLLTATGPLTLALLGVDDPHIHRDRMPEPCPAWSQQEGASPVLRLALTHAPYRRVLDAMTDAGADLILAGHTHGGQLGLPFVRSLVTNCDLPRSHGKWMSDWEHDGAVSALHVSAGLGTSPYVPFRIATRPEAALIHIRSM